MKPYRIVTPYRPFVPEAPVHTLQASFDWISALRMVTTTAKWSNHCDVRVLTDLTTEVPAPALRYATTSTRLTLWILEIRLRYLESDDFTIDTVTVDADELIYGSLAPWFPKSAALTVLVRADPRFQTPDAWPLLNGVQWWRAKRKKQLVRFYREALTRAQQMSEDRLVWGSESDAVRSLIEPIEYGVHERSGLRVQMVNVEEAMETFSSRHMSLTEEGQCPWPTRPILDFRWTRKRWQRPCFEQTWLRASRDLLEASA